MFSLIFWGVNNCINTVGVFMVSRKMLSPSRGERACSMEKGIWLM